MFLKFAQNISESKDYCSYWEINKFDEPAPVDFRNDKDFWYNLPANFDVIYKDKNNLPFTLVAWLILFLVVDIVDVEIDVV